jgi:hypothetical protein
MALERSQPLPPPDLERLRELLETVHHRLERIEERQDFTDQLLGSGADPRPARARAGGPDAQITVPRQG